MAQPAPLTLSIDVARRHWLRAQRLDSPYPFGEGTSGAALAVAHLGYVQIDTINVIERCHHHILFNRIPSYRPAHLHAAQSQDKSVFEYWTHALSYVAASDFRFYRGAMLRHRREPVRWFGPVQPNDVRRVVSLIRRSGPLSIRDIEDDVPVDKVHPWASRKPSKRALQLAFFNGVLTVTAREGMLKTYDLTERHFAWKQPPRPATEREVAEYLVERALRSQGVPSLDSICYGVRRYKASVSAILKARVARRTLVPVRLAGLERVEHWITPESLTDTSSPTAELVHLLSPFDPLLIQRERTEQFFGYRHLFEAYVPQAKRKFGYFALPVLVDDRIVAAIDLKADRAAGKLLVQQWTWIGRRRARDRGPIEEALHRFERFQLER